jgi:hypothetical protein
MNAMEIVVMVVIIGSTVGFLTGYRVSKIIAKNKENAWWAEMTYEDQISESPIYNKLMREYGNLFDMPRQ